MGKTNKCLFMGGKKKEKLDSECKICHKKLKNEETFLVTRYSKDVFKYDRIDVYCEKHTPKK